MQFNSNSNNYNLNSSFNVVPINPGSISGCVVYFPLNEGTGSYGYDRITGMTGSFVSGMYWDAGRYTSGVRSLSSTDNVYFRIGSLGMSSTNLTVSMWVRHNIGVGAETNGFPGFIGNESPRGFILYQSRAVNSNQIGYKFWDSASTVYDNIVGGTILASGIWQHVAFTWKNGSISDYRNGKLDTPTKVFASTGSIRIGQTIRLGMADSPGDYNISDFSVFNRVLTSNEIYSIYKSNLPKYQTLSLDSSSVTLSSNNQIELLSPGSFPWVQSYWDFNNVIGSTAYDRVSGAEIRIMSGANFTGAIYNSGINFPLSGLASGTTLPFKFNGGSSYTYSLWINPQPTENYLIRLISPKGTAGVYHAELRLYSGTKLSFGNARYDGFNNPSAIALSGVEPNIWSNVSTTYNKNDKYIRVYTNGSLLGSALDNTTTTSIDGATNVYFGNTTDLTRSFLGTMAEMAVYNRDLSSEEIYQLYKRNKPKYNLTVSKETNISGLLPSDISGCVMWYDFETINNGSYILDKISNKPGSIVGFPKPEYTNGFIGSGLGFYGYSGGAVTGLGSSILFLTRGLPVSVNSDWSTSVWFKIANHSAYHSDAGHVIGMFDYNSWIKFWNSNYVSMTFNKSPGGDTGKSPVIKQGQWNHGICIRDLTNQEVRFYMNGVLAGSQIGVTTLGGGDDVLYIGANPGYANFQYLALSGLVDDFSLYNKALSHEEAIQLYWRYKPKYTTIKEVNN
jgi:hypothetical protein